MNKSYDVYMCRGLQHLIGTHVSNLFRFKRVVDRACMVKYDLQSGVITKILSGHNCVLLEENESCLVFNNDGKMTYHFNHDGKMTHHSNPQQRKVAAESKRVRFDYSAYIASVSLLALSLWLCFK